MNKIEEIKIETLINTFTVEKGKLKILLERKKEEPYKGYWILPGNTLDARETLEENIENVLDKTLKTTKIYIEQNYVFSELDRNPNERIVAISYLGLVDSKIKEIKEKNEEIELSWFNIDEIPKTAYDHKQIIDKTLSELKIRLLNTNILKNLFPSDFTLPELQSIFETITNKKLDRRNFRKKFLTLDLIEETGYNSIGSCGRPAKLYRFKENIKDINLF